MQGRPQAIWSEAALHQGKRRPPLEGLGQSRIFIQKEPRPGRPGACVHPCLSMSLPHAGQPPLEGGRASVPPTPGKGSSPRSPRAPGRDEGTSGGSGWPGPRQAEGCREGTACSPSPSRALWASAQPAALPEWTFLLPAPGCRLPLSSWGCTKWPPQPSAILCVRLAGRRPGRGGGRETTVRPLPRVAWTEPSSSPRPSSALAAAALGLAPAHVLARPSGNPGPSPSPASPLAAPSLP